LPGLLGAIEAGADLAIGSRYVGGGSTPRWPISRRALSRLGNRYASGVLALPLADVTSGFRAYRADIVAALDLRTVRADGYGFQIEMAYRVAREGGRVVELPIAFVDRRRGVSKMSSRVIAEAVVLVLRLKWHERAERRAVARPAESRVKRATPRPVPR